MPRVFFVIHGWVLGYKLLEKKVLEWMSRLAMRRRAHHRSLLETTIIASPQIAIKVADPQNRLRDSLRPPEIMNRVSILDTSRVPCGASPLVGQGSTGETCSEWMLGIKM